MANKRDKKAFSQQKRYRRRWISFMRVCRYGFSNFIRNAWLTVAATAVMTITLIIILLTVAAQNILSDTTTSISKKIDRSQLILASANGIFLIYMTKRTLWCRGCT